MRRTLALAPNKARVLQKEVVAHGLSRVRPVYLISEYPKSGGTWLKYMLADALDLPAWTKPAPVTGSCVMQAHWLKPRGRCRTVALFRDGRDVMVSYYFHSFFRNEFQNAAYTRFMRDTFGFADYQDVRANLLPFMKRMFDNPVSPGFSWLDFVNAWHGKAGVATTSYEALRADTGAELSRLVGELRGAPLPLDRAKAVAEMHTMERMRARKAAEAEPAQQAEVSFIRKGSVGGWNEHFTDEALDWFENRAGGALRALGYNLGRPEQ